MYRRTTGRGGSAGTRLVLAAIIAIISLISYFSARVENPVTGETQHINISTEQEIALGLQAAPEMEAEYGGLEPDSQLQALVDDVGNTLVANSAASRSPYQFEFHLLDDDQTINAFALPGGQVFITNGLLQRLQTEGQLAGVLGHEIGHVIGRHSAEHIAKAQLTQGLTGAAVLASYDPNNPSSQRTAQVAILIGQLVNLKFTRDDELESDFLGVCIINAAGYDPRELIEVMKILAEASGPQRQPEFLSTHPDPGNRVTEIENAIQNLDRCP